MWARHHQQFGTALLVVLFLLVYRRWIFTLQPLVHGDWHFLFPEEMKAWARDSFSLWISDTAFGRPFIDVGYAFTNMLYGVLGVMGVPFAIAERMIHLWPIVIVTPLSASIFLRQYFQRRAVVWIGIFVYTFNTYFLLLQTGHLRLMAAYAFAPIIFFYYQKTLQHRTLKFAITTALWSFVSSSYEPRGFYVIAWMLFFYLIFVLFTEQPHQKKGRITSLLGWGLLPLTIFGLLISPWVIGLLASGEFVNSELLDRGIFGEEFLDLPHALTLMHPFWTGSEPIVFSIQQIPAFFWLIPILAWIGFVNRRTRRPVMTFFFLLMLLGVLLTKQTSPPFEHLYPWLYDHLPGFKAFREASKFYLWMIMADAVLIASAVDGLWTTSLRPRWHWLKPVGTIGVAVLFLWNTRPLITGELRTLFEPREIPRDAQIVRAWLGQQSDSFRTLWLPDLSPWGFQSRRHPVVVPQDLEFILSSQKDDLPEPLMSENDFFSNEFLDATSIRIVIATDPKERRKAESAPYLRQLDLGTTDWAIFENTGSKPNIFLSSSSKRFEDAMEWKPVSFNSPHPSTTTLAIRDLSGIQVLHVTQHDHPAWKISARLMDPTDPNRRWVPLSSSHGDADELGFQVYTLDAKEIERQLLKDASRRPIDGRVDIELKLFYAPQRFLQVSLVIFLGTILASLWFLVIDKQTPTIDRGAPS
jgi:hypothetical protein